ncbi:MAG: hypothetical protein ABL951_05540 [Alphaproteobacteria bacterium]
MRLRSLITILASVICMLAPTAQASDDAQSLAQRFLATISPPGARISFASAEGSADAITVRGVVAHAQSAAGEETVQRIEVVQLHGVEALPSGLFRVARLRAENVRIDGAADQLLSGPGSVRIAAVTASGVDGARIGALALSGIELSASAGGVAYVIHIDAGSLENVDAQSLTRAAMAAQSDPQSARREDALLNSLLNASSYGALQVRGVSVRKGETVLLSIAELVSKPDGNYAPFPASGSFAIRNASLDLRDPMAAVLRQWLGQDRLQFSLESRHDFSAPASHAWDTTLKLSPDATLAGTCAAQNLNGFSPALIRAAQAAASNPATLRWCDLSFTGDEFVNRWLAQDGARQGLSMEEARAKYLAGTLLVSLDPQTANDPMALQLATAGQIFLTQPSRLNIQLAPPGGLKFPDSVATFVMLFQGGAEQKRMAMQKLGLSISAVPLN